MALRYTLTLLEGTPSGTDLKEGPVYLVGRAFLSAAFHESLRHAEDNRCVLGTGLLSILSLSRGSRLSGLLGQSNETL